MSVDMEQVKRIIATESFSEQIQSAESAEEFRKAFSDNGLELSEAELIRTMEAIAQSENDELDADSLDEVAGGMIAGAFNPIAATQLALKMYKRFFGAFGGGSGGGVR